MVDIQKAKRFIDLGNQKCATIFLAAELYKGVCCLRGLMCLF